MKAAWKRTQSCIKNVKSVTADYDRIFKNTFPAPLPDQRVCVCIHPFVRVCVCSDSPALHELIASHVVCNTLLNTKRYTVCTFVPVKPEKSTNALFISA